jgi:hypothetical protein
MNYEGRNEGHRPTQIGTDKIKSIRGVVFQSICAHLWPAFVSRCFSAFSISPVNRIEEKIQKRQNPRNALNIDENWCRGRSCPVCILDKCSKTGGF